MKKFLAAIMLASMILSVGCGNKVEEAKQEAVADVKDAAAKVEQKAAEVAGTSPINNVDRRIKLTFDVSNSSIVEIKCSLRD